MSLILIFIALSLLLLFICIIIATKIDSKSSPMDYMIGYVASTIPILLSIIFLITNIK